MRFGFIALYVAFLLLPLYWMAVTSFKSQDDQLSEPPVWFPSDPTSINTRTRSTASTAGGLENSLVVAFATTFLAVLFGTAAAYSMARYRTGGKHLAFWFLSQRMMPPIAIVIPIFLLYSRYAEEWLGFTLNETMLGLILLFAVLALPFTVWMMYRYFRQMPRQARGGGAGGRLLAIPGAGQDRLAARGAGNRLGGRLRVHLLPGRSSSSPRCWRGTTR